MGDYMDTIRERAVVYSSILILSIAITNISYLISKSICDYFKIKEFTYYSVMYMQDMIIDLMILFMLIIDIAFFTTIYKSLTILLEI